MRLGFSYTGAVMLGMLFVPNLFWTRGKPEGYEDCVKNESGFLRALERIGEAAVSTLCLICSDFNPAPGLWSLWLAGAAVLMVMYELYWIRYFRSGRTLGDFYSSFLGIPVAGASLPVLAFFLLAVYGRNVPLGLAAVVLGIGHIGIHLNHRKELAAV